MTSILVFWLLLSVLCSSYKFKKVETPTFPKSYRCKPAIKHETCSNNPQFDFLDCWDKNDPNAKGDIIINENNDDIDQKDPYYQVPLREAHESDGASCLDGSVPLYYFYPGFNDQESNYDGRSKYLLYFEGGGWCAGYKKHRKIEIKTL